MKFSLSIFDYTFTNYMIRNGKIAEPVSDVTLTGNVFQTLKDIDAIGMGEQRELGELGRLEKKDGGDGRKIKLEFISCRFRL